jgi:CO/xanthine dehydrogenase Mo-binding subunit
MTTSSSRATFAVGNAVEAAAADLVDRVAEAASVSLGVPPDRLDRDGDRFVDREGGRAVALAAVAAAAPGGEILGRGTFVNEPERDVDTGEPVSSSHWHQGAVAVDIAVDVGTGVVRVERAAGAAWAGRVVNPPGARLQNEGNVIFGLGPSLFESLEFPDGAPDVTDLLDYRLPTIADVPVELATRTLEAPQTADEPVERHGLGESLIPAVAPAIGNAVAAAVGGRVRSLPISPERVLAALDAGDTGDSGETGTGR